MMSPLSFIVMLLIMIIIPTILYCFFFLITCPPNNPFNICLRRRVEGSKMVAKKEAARDDNGNVEMVVGGVGVTFELGKDTDCPVCLSAFTQGEELKQLNICKHFFHKSCIDKWLSTHFNCPVCRAFVASHYKPKVREREDRDDFWQGLPDSAGLV